MAEGGELLSGSTPSLSRSNRIGATEMDKEQEKAAKARDAALSGALTQIERTFGKGSIMRMGDEDAAVKVSAIPTARWRAISRREGAGCRRGGTGRLSARSRSARPRWRSP